MTKLKLVRGGGILSSNYALCFHLLFLEANVTTFSPAEKGAFLAELCKVVYSLFYVKKIFLHTT